MVLTQIPYHFISTWHTFFKRNWLITTIYGTNSISQNATIIVIILNKGESLWENF